jgi:hypothetical protein
VIRRYEHSDRTREATMNSIKRVFDAANQSAEAVNRQIINTIQRNLNAGLDLAKSLAGARDPSEIVKLQTSFWWKQFTEFTTQAEEVRKRLFGFGTAEQEPTPDPGPREPASKSVTRSHQEQSPTAQDPIAKRPKQKPDRQNVETPPLAAQASKTTESEVVRPKPRIQRTTAKPGSTSRHPARKQGRLKPQATRAREVTRANVPRPHERQSGSQKKGAPHEHVPQVLPTGVKFGMLDGNAVRFNNIEAWWLVDGAWRSISPGEVLSSAAVMREERFKQLFPQLPILPRKAFQSDSR